MKASHMLNILAHLPADVEILTEKAEEIFVEDVRKILPAQIAERLLPAAPPATPAPTLRTDGPTLKEYVAAGYGADTYPPAGYAAREEQPE